MRQSQEGNTKKIPLSVKLDKNRLITHKQTTKINLERCRKMKEEFQQPKGKKGRKMSHLPKGENQGKT